MKKRLCICVCVMSVVLLCFGCDQARSVMQSFNTSTQETIVEILEEKYPEKSFQVVEQDGLYYNVVDADGIEFQVEPIMSGFSRFWCTDNYLDAYFQANGVVDQCNEVLARYDIENRVEIGEPFELNLGVIDNDENCVQMAACLDELTELMKVPFEVTYYDKGTPQQGEKYKGSSKTGTFSYISFDYTFQEPHIMVSVGDGTISIEEIQNVVEGSEILEGMIVQVKEYDAIGEALEPEFYVRLKETIEMGNRPVEVYGDDYRNFNSSIEMIHDKTKKLGLPIMEVRNDGKDEDGYTMLRVIVENGDEMVLHLGMNEGDAYSYKLEDSYMVKSDTEKEFSEELVSVNYFMDYYKLQDTDIPVDYIEAFIRDKQLTENKLGELNYDKMLIKMHERGVTFGRKIVDLIQGEVVSLSEKDDFSDVAYIVISKELYPDGTDASVEENTILEVENQKIYITSKGVTDDYSTEENVRDVTEENMREYLQQLRSIITNEWVEYHHVENKEYSWKLYIVKEDGSLIYYEGESVDEVHHSGFENWLSILK